MSKFQAIFGGAPKMPDLPPPPPPPPTREDPAIAARKREVEAAERRRRGRAASNITSGSALGDAEVNRPGLRTTNLLGG